MKAGYKVENVHVWSDADYIIIGNFHNANKVCGFYYYDLGHPIKGYANEASIGVWKIKRKYLKS